MSEQGSRGCHGRHKVEVFVLDASTYWRPASQRPPACGVVRERSPAVFLNGLLHFLCRDGGDIVTFDVGGETFGSSPPVPVSEDAMDVEVGMTELDGCLCAFHGKLMSDEPYHVWLLRCHEEGEQWELLCRIDRATWTEHDLLSLRSLSIAPLSLHYGDDGCKKIMFRTGSCWLFTVGLDGAAVPEILFTPEDTIVGRCKDSVIPSLGMFEESLVSVGRAAEVPRRWSSRRRRPEHGHMSSSGFLRRRS